MTEIAEVLDRSSAAPPGDGAEDLHRVLAEHRPGESLLAGEKQTLEMIAAGAPLTPVLDAVNRVIEARVGPRSTLTRRSERSCL